MSDYQKTRDAAGNVTSQYGQMLRNLDDDLVKRLRSKIIAHTDAAVWMLEAADHIEELEAKLAKAIEALEGVRSFTRDLGLYADQGHTLAPALRKACDTLAELKGQDDE